MKYLLLTATLVTFCATYTMEKRESQQTNFNIVGALPDELKIYTLESAGASITEIFKNLGSFRKTSKANNNLILTQPLSPALLKSVINRFGFKAFLDEVVQKRNRNLDLTKNDSNPYPFANGLIKRLFLQMHQEDEISFLTHVAQFKELHVDRYPIEAIDPIVEYELFLIHTEREKAKEPLRQKAWALLSLTGFSCEKSHSEAINFLKDYITLNPCCSAGSCTLHTIHKEILNDILRYIAFLEKETDNDAAQKELFI